MLVLINEPLLTHQVHKWWRCRLEPCDLSPAAHRSPPRSKSLSKSWGRAVRSLLSSEPGKEQIEIKFTQHKNHTQVKLIDHTFLTSLRAWVLSTSLLCWMSIHLNTDQHIRDIQTSHLRLSDQDTEAEGQVCSHFNFTLKAS